MTPEEFRELCTSSKTPLAFAESCAALTEADRKKLSKVAQEFYAAAVQAERANFRMPSYEGDIARLAMLAVCPWSQAKRVTIGGLLRFSQQQGPWRDAARQILTDRRPDWATDWVSAQLNVGDAQWLPPLSWRDVRELMCAGVIERPASDGYIRLLAGNGFREFDLERDQEILETDLWRLFEVESGVFDFFPEPQKIDREKWDSGERATQPGRLYEVYDGWPRRLYEMSRLGQIDRQRLIDSIVAAFWRNLRGPMRTGLLRFFEFVDPTEDEIKSRQDAFGELLHNEHGPFVGAALKALAKLQRANRLDVNKFLDAVPPAFAVTAVAQPKSALSLIDRATKNSSQYFPAALKAIQAALNHQSADVQEIAVDLLVKWKASDPTLDLSALSESVTFLAASQRKRVEELTGDQKPGASDERRIGTTVFQDRPEIRGHTTDLEDRRTTLDARRQAVLQRLAALPQWLRTIGGIEAVEFALSSDNLPPVFDPDPVSFPVLSGVEPIEPIRDVDELIDAAAHLYEAVDGMADVERIVDGIFHLAGETTDNFGLKTTELRSKLEHSDHSGFLVWHIPSAQKLVRAWLGVTRSPSAIPLERNLPASDTYEKRFEFLCLRFKRGEFGPVLATPTHKGGWIDPRTFVARVKSICDAQFVPQRNDFLCGLLRLAPDFRTQAIESAAALPDPYRRIIRYALGAAETPVKSDSEMATLWLAAGRTRRPRGDLHDLKILGLSDNEPDGITAAKYQYLPQCQVEKTSTYRWEQITHRWVTVTPSTIPSGKLEDRPTVALAGRAVNPTSIGFVAEWLQELLAWLWPANPDATLALGCQRLMAGLDEKGSSYDPLAGYLGPLKIPDRGWSEMGRTAIWLSLICRDDVARGIGVDVLIEGITDGRAHADFMSPTLVHIASGGRMKLNRLSESLRQVAQTSVLAERVISEILNELIASWKELPRDAHYVLALQLELLSSLGRSLAPKSREVLANFIASGKTAKLAKQLCNLSSDGSSQSNRQSAIEAAEGRLVRAERISRYFASNGVPSGVRAVGGE